MAKCKKPDASMGILDERQKDFIQAKVVRLGSLEAVEQDYSRGDTVSNYALKFARWCYDKRQTK